MKTARAFAIGMLAASAYATAETEQTADRTLEAQIIKLDKQRWEAWKNNDPAWFTHNTTESFRSISSAGTGSKAEVVRGIPTDYQVASYSLADANFTALDKNVVLLTCTVTQGAVCGGQKAPSFLRVAMNDVGDIRQIIESTTRVG